ncbi:MAG TPA: glycosyltransferase, partial [Roseimicrobium sp.]|nr:glycosyltransferase [Roseimicrobium sp.]
YLSLCTPDTPESVKRSASEYSKAHIWIPWHEARKGSIPFYFDLASNLVRDSLPYALSKYRSKAFRAKVDELDAGGKFDLIVCDFLVPSVNLFPRANSLVTPVTLFQHNVEALIWRRMTDNAQGLPQSYLRLQWERMRQAEQSLARQFDSVIGVSDEDCEMMRADYGLSNVLGSVPTGVDVEYYQPSSTPRKPRSIAFLGSMDWQPNIDGIRWFHAEVWPSLKKQMPDISLKIIGRRPVDFIKQLAAGDPAIEVTGTVDDVRPHLSQVQAMVVPLRVGGGTRIKIYESMAMGIPVVSTRIGAEGLSVTDGENILLADEPDAMRDGIVHLLDSNAMQESIGGKGRKLVCDHFSWQAVTSVFEQHCFATRYLRKKETP